jgi:hypothetical protein
MTDRVTGIPREDQLLAVELARLVLDRAAPTEIEVLDETAVEFFRDPGALFGEGRDEALGSGILDEFLTPYVLAAVGPVLQFLIGVVSAAVQEEAKPRVRLLVRRLLRLDSPKDPALSLTPEQARTVRGLAIDNAMRAGLSRTKAQVMADALVGSLVVAG